MVSVDGSAMDSTRKFSTSVYSVGGCLATPDMVEWDITSFNTFYSV